jgi:RimJ/RimL family protein N-acetyltransferase
VRLRPPTPHDVEALTAACRDPEIPRWTRIPTPYTRADAEAFVAGATDDWEEGSAAVFVIEDAATGKLLGSTGLGRIDHQDRVAEVGYWVAREARGRGVATRAVGMVSRWALAEAGVDRLEALASVENGPSRRVAEACGYRDEGVLRSRVPAKDGTRHDCVMYALLREDLAGG